MNRLAWIGVAILIVSSSTRPASSMICIAESITLREVQGIVVVDDGWEFSILPGARVRMSKGELEVEVRTDEDGYFRFSNLPQGNYQITADFEGFQSTVAEVMVRRQGAEEGRVLMIEMPLIMEYCGQVVLEPWKKVREIQLRSKREREARIRRRLARP